MWNENVTIKGGVMRTYCAESGAMTARFSRAESET